MTEALQIRTEQGVMEYSAPQLRELMFPPNKPQPTDREILHFINVCQAKGMNPFIGEAYLLKYNDNAPATHITGKDYFTKICQRNGGRFKAGIVVIREGVEEEIRKEGTLIRKDETLVGGWARIFRKGERMNLAAGEGHFVEVTMDELASQTATWKKMPATMIRKCAIVAALREVFPDDFGGLYDAAERQAQIPEVDIVAMTGGGDESSEGIASVETQLPDVTKEDSNIIDIKVKEESDDEDDKPYDFEHDLEIIRANDIDEAFQKLPNPMEIDDFVSELRKLYPDHDKEKIQAVIQEYLGEGQDKWLKRNSAKGYGLREAYILILTKELDSETHSQVEETEDELPW
ncbi:hypothetical protein [uncultured Mediterranean phage uvDeep-CGR2-KM18-C74]|nr:hypothetical protein [uncultured Mediterranean phage uvDeep-CGR2-KM18-C74]